MWKYLFLVLLAPTILLFAEDDRRIQLYQRLDPTSISQHLAFYELYKKSPEGDEAFQHALKLMSPLSNNTKQEEFSFPATVDNFISLINPIETGASYSLKQESLDALQHVCQHLANRSLKGYNAKSIDEVLTLAPEEIDLSKALLLSQFSDKNKIDTFLTQIDMMALQVLARTGFSATPEEKIRAINQLIFFEMGFRFPPHSAYSGQIDHFTFLPEVLESRRGVCLGVSTLYLCIAQRINLPLEIITPPGHIYVRYKDTDKEINIETTLRGVHIPSHEYLGMNNKTLEKRTLKEVIGMAHYNHASIYLAQQQFDKACDAYANALPFMPNDLQLKILYGASLFITNRTKEAMKLLNIAQATKDSVSISPNILAVDILNGAVDAESLKPYFLYVDHTRESILKKKEALVRSCKKCPRFRAGLFQLATCWLQLDQEKEAIKCLQAYHALDSSDILVEYYLAGLYYANYNVESAWKHCSLAEGIALQAGYTPEPLKELTLALATRSPRSSS